MEKYGNIGQRGPGKLQPDGLRGGRDHRVRAADDQRRLHRQERQPGDQERQADILCKPWYCGDAPLHIPNNTDWTSTPKNGHMVIKEQCFGISDVDPAIAQVRKLEKQGA
jgi:hypothetical protein